MNFTINVEMGRFSIAEREKIERTLKGKSTIDLLSDYIIDLFGKLSLLK